ncbi:hypothetical protein ABIB85_007820 [Bradyrhizobium sp. JR1.5]|jgi:hypothetical protein|nr:hypothetical protein Bra1253DRAFT_00103 [Bradyrhizobium sp. WSM1253]
MKRCSSRCSRATTAAMKISVPLLDMRHIVRRLYVDGPAVANLHQRRRVVNDQDSANARCLPPSSTAFQSLGRDAVRYRLRVGTSMVTTTATRTKTRTMASASKDPIALISVRPAIFPNVNSSEGRSRAANRIGGDYCALPSPRTRHVSGPSGCIDKRGDRATAPLRHICVFRFLCFLCCICF